MRRGAGISQREKEKDDTASDFYAQREEADFQKDKRTTHGMARNYMQNRYFLFFQKSF